MWGCIEMREIELNLVKVKERGEGLYGKKEGGKLEVRKGATLFYEAFDGAIKLKIEVSYKKQEDFEKMKKSKIKLVIR